MHVFIVKLLETYLAESKHAKEEPTEFGTENGIAFGRGAARLVPLFILKISY